MQQRVVVVGAGYGGVVVARELDDAADVVLVEPKDAFVHAAGTLRAVVDPSWQERVFFPYDGLLSRGRIEHDWVQLATPHGVHLPGRRSFEADYLVLATGTAYPFPAKFLENERVVVEARLSRLRWALADADDVLLVGGGPVGLELAGELTSAFPDLGVTIVDKAPDILTTGDYLPELRDQVRTQLEQRGVRFVLGAPLAYLPPVDVGLFAPFVVDTTAGERVEAQLWFRCYGTQPATDYLGTELAGARRPDGHLEVTPTLTVAGFDTVFAVGDIVDLPETKRASAARDHALVVAENIRALLDGKAPSATYTPAPERIVLPLGPDGGASQLAEPDGRRVVHGPDVTRRLKGADLMSGFIAELLGVRTEA